nr:MAG TPA: hypothetical protein [Caudoviricetes sp.]
MIWLVDWLVDLVDWLVGLLVVSVWKLHSFLLNC